MTRFLNLFGLLAWALIGAIVGAIFGAFGGNGADLLEVLGLVQVEVCDSCSAAQEALFTRSYYIDGVLFTAGIFGITFFAFSAISIWFPNKGNSLNTLDPVTDLPTVGLGSPIKSSAPFSGKQKVFYDFYRDILGDQQTAKILDQHYYENSCLYGLHAAAVKLTAIPRSKLLALSGADPELMGFADQLPNVCKSWRTPAEHFKAEASAGKPLE